MKQRKNVRHFKLHGFYNNRATNYYRSPKTSLVVTERGVSVMLLWSETGVPRENSTRLSGLVTPQADTENRTRAALMRDRCVNHCVSRVANACKFSNL